ncbi:MAG: peptidoglycan DD-metalloendopeptidase family protein [Patescibacteria group bacterium]
MRKFIGIWVFVATLALINVANVAAVRYPLNNWDPGCNTFWSTCRKAYHTGVDVGASEWTKVYAPFSGIVRDAKSHSGYAGTVIIEGREGGEYVCEVLGHMKSNALKVRAGQWVSEGQLIGYIAKRYENGGNYAPHIHYGIRRGRYQTGNTCDGGWKYHGYAAKCDKGNWYDPLLFTPFANAYRAGGGNSKVGSPTNDFHNWCGAIVRDYNGGSYGWCIIIQNGPNACVVRTGFWEKYRAMGGPCSWLGKPNSNEFGWNGLARQNFDNGYMLWHGSYVGVYNKSGRRLLVQEMGTDPVKESINLTLYPNPFNPETSIGLSLDAEQRIQLEVYDVQGKRVLTLANGILPAGEHMFKWDGKDGSGNQVASGIYFARLITRSSNHTRKMVLLK